MKNFSRRSFLEICKALSAGTLLSSFSRPSVEHALAGALKTVQQKTPEQLATDEDFWYQVRQAYSGSTYFIDLNSAGMAASPKIVQEALIADANFCNQIPSFAMRRLLDTNKENLRRNLARLCGVTADEMAILRNATEALEILIMGLPLNRGDEVVVCKQDYSTMVVAWKQREQRDGIKLVWVDLQLPSEDNDYLVNAYTKAFTAKTKLVHLTHMINWNGQIIPVRRIADIAHKQGIEVIIDAAQTLGQIPLTVPETGADYFAASLHKWLSAPIGTGILVVKKEKIKKVTPLFATTDPQSDDIRKFEHFGTHPVFIEQAINKAIEFYEMLGAQRKEQRLQYLKNYWMSRVQHLPGVQLGTSMKPGFGCAITLINVKGKEPAEFENFLLHRYNVHSVTLNHDIFKGVRISVNVFTSLQDLDMLVTGIKAFIGA
jgi:selenocysteine lyase/cysteine desulfurase